MVAFYAIALGLAAVLLWIPYAEWTHLHRVNARVAGFCVLTAIALIWAVLPRADTFTAPGLWLDAESSPQLFSAIRSVADATQQSMPSEVFLVNEVNAWVSHRGGIMGVGSRRVMGLGLPLMQGLTVGELKAVLAHEFGHYAAGDVKLGPWIYKTRAAIGRTLESLSESSLEFIFKAYGDLFMRMTLAISRQQEFLADALAARVTHPSVMASALRRTSGLAPAFSSYWNSEVSPALTAGYLPPVGTGFSQFLGVEQISTAIAKAIDRAAATGESSRYDTHPPLRERLEALARLSTPAAMADNRPASALLGDVDRYASELIAFAFPDDAKDLRQVGWDQLASEIYPREWRQTVHRFAQFLSAHTADALPVDRAQLIALGSSLPGGGTRGSEERLSTACGVLSCAVAVVLLDLGATLQTQPGQPFSLHRGGVSMQPFNDVPRVVSGELPLAAWKARCHAIGIAGRSLGPQSAVH
jgi:Zn-dependent protease with chaperone function